MNGKMNINQVERITGVSKRNIRFYEKEGLLLPGRNKENGYRVYEPNDIWRVKVIRMLRMLDMPLEKIGKVLGGEERLSAALSEQQAELERKAKELQAAISFCQRLRGTELDALDVDGCLRHMEQTDQKGFFTKWIEDYKCVLRSNRDMDFSFVPETPITNPREFTDALCAFAGKEHKNLVITKESMYPEFLIDGVAYEAERHYSVISRVPVAVVRCRRKDRTVYGDTVAEPRKHFQWFLHRWGAVAAVILICLAVAIPMLLQDGVTWEDVLMFVSLLLLVGVMAFRNILLHFNDKSR